MSTILSVAFPFFGVILAGFCAGKFSIIPAADAQSLNRFVFSVAMPAALFGITSAAEPLNSNDFLPALIYLAAALIAIFGAYFSARLWFNLPRPDAGAHAFTATLGNAVFLGLPIAQSIDGWGRPFIVFMLVEGGIIITIGAILMSARVEESASDRKTPISDIVMRPFKNPLVVASFLGFLFSATGGTLPDPVARFFGLIGRAAGPTALFSLGLFLSTLTLEKEKFLAPANLHIFTIKMILLPAMAFLGMHLFGITNSATIGAMMLFTLVPSGIVTYISSMQRGRYTEEVVNAIAATTLISILTVSGVLYLLA